MIVTYGSTVICSSSVAGGRVGPVGIVLDGQSLIDVANFVNAVHTAVFARGRGPRELAFQIQAFFATEADAVAFFLTHEDALALQDDLKIEDDAESVSYTMADAAGQARMVRLMGVCVIVEYRFTGAKFTLDSP